MSELYAKIKELAMLADISETEAMQAVNSIAKTRMGTGLDVVTSILAMVKAAVSAKTDQPPESCPTRLLDGRNEIRCWLTAGHEGPCK